MGADLKADVEKNKIISQQNNSADTIIGKGAMMQSKFSPMLATLADKPWIRRDGSLKSNGMVTARLQSVMKTKEN